MHPGTRSLFPHNALRPVQDAFISQVDAAVAQGTCLVAHAPTGIGKTAASLTPTLAYAIAQGMTVFFLTSRHMQHRIAIDTLRQMKERSATPFSVVDIVGKKWMCAQNGVDALSSRQFHDYCKTMRDDDACTYYLNVRKGSVPTPASQQALQALAVPTHTGELVASAKACGVCPYEIALLAAQKAQVIIADYYYLFNTGIREPFLSKIKKELDKSILIIDEGHNLPGRMRALLTETLSTSTVERAIHEAEKHERDKERGFLASLRDVLSFLAAGQNERFVSARAFVEAIEQRGYDYDAMATLLELSGSDITHEEKQSALHTVALFLQAWRGPDKGYARILRATPGRHGAVLSLSYRCLDPSIATAETLRQAHAVILMSGTLTPTAMYRDILGFPERTADIAYTSPFPVTHKLSLIIPETTTKYSRRNEQEYRHMAAICADIIDAVPGNSILFFPSYSILGEVHKHLHGRPAKPLFKESPHLTAEEKTRLLAAFSGAHKSGAALLAVIGGNFSEGIDLAGDLLKGVIVVGLPLQHPDLETKALIDYYDTRFGKGWDYGYVLPAFTRALQSAGRCIRSETDRGVIVFLDERYAWPRYYACFPKGEQPAVTSLYKQRIKEFFTTNE